jgi:hypothetical protein
MTQRGHRGIQFNVLTVMLVSGAMGAPLLSPIRETLQQEMGISRSSLGLWMFILGAIGSGVGLIGGIYCGRAPRTTLVRYGTATLAAACWLLALTQPTGPWALLSLGLAWLLISTSRPLVATSNGIFADVWDRSPHTGVILLHAVNAGGKVVAPLVVLVIGASITGAGLLFAGIMTAVAVHSLTWSRPAVQELITFERKQANHAAPRLPRDPLLWTCAFMFFLISGAEAGMTAILGSLIETSRPSPLTALSPARWAAICTAVMLTGILIGRVLLTFWSRWLSERAIITVCLACGLSTLPAALGRHWLIYLPALLMNGVAFSAVWPAFYALAARNYRADKTFLALGAAFFTLLGTSACIYFSSAVGNAEHRLPLAVILSTAILLPFAAFFYLTPWGRGLGSTRGSDQQQVAAAVADMD